MICLFNRLRLHFSVFRSFKFHKFYFLIILHTLANGRMPFPMSKRLVDSKIILDIFKMTLHSFSGEKFYGLDSEIREETMGFGFRVWVLSTKSRLV